MATEPVPVWYTCHICGAILTDHKCLSCDHVQCAECPVYVPEPTKEELMTRIAQLEGDWKRLNRVFKSTSDKTIDQDIKIERLEAERDALRAELEKPWTHSEHWLNPETGQVECECCCKWALDAAEDHIRTAKLEAEKKILSDALMQIIEICKKEL